LEIEKGFQNEILGDKFKKMSPEIQIYQATEVAENIHTLKGGMPMKHTTE